MIASVLLLLIALTDIARTAHEGRTAVAWMVGVNAATAALATLGLGLPWWTVGGCLVLVLGWVVALPVDASSVPQRIWPMAALVLLIAALTLVERPAADAGGVVADAFARFVAGTTSIETAIAAVAVALFVTASGNLVTRAALDRAHRRPVDDATDWRKWLVRRLRGVVGRRREAETSGLRGGRWIGPLERLLIVVLALTGAQTIIAALIAAKGIVRFPELSEDKGTGSKAEEFLIGSLTSWAVAVTGVIYLAAVRAG